MEKLCLIKNTNPKSKPTGGNLGFGSIMTDHMFVMDYVEGEGWISPRIVPYGPIDIEPCARVLHYGQASFEGMKAYKTEQGDINLFRPELNFERMNKTHERMCIPQLDVQFCIEALEQLLILEKDWIPTEPGTSMYIRPFVIATEYSLGIKKASNYKFMIILSPSGNYYEEGLNPVSILVENKYVRAVRGGTGFAKCPSNYAASLLSQNLASTLNCSQVLWLDGVKREYIEEVGSMNFMFVRNSVLYTPKLNGSILPGITRRSVLELLSTWDIEIIEEDIRLEDFMSWARNNEITEAFGTGTAAVISPVGQLRLEEELICFNNNEIGELSQRLYTTLTDIQYSRIADEFKWVHRVS